MRHVISALVENTSGVLAHVAGLFSSRGFNIDSLTVGRTENPNISRMTIVVDADAEKIRTQLYKLINVIQVQDVTEIPDVSRDLALIKVRVNSQTRGEVVQLCDIFRAHIVDATTDAVIVEVTGDEDKITSMTELLRPIGILEMVRTGMVTMTRGEHVLSLSGYKPRPGGNGYRTNVL